MEKNTIQKQITEPTDEELAVLARNGDPLAWADIVSRYIPLVKSRAHDFSGADLENEDLSQEGLIGLFRAVKSYRTDGGASFRTFAILCIDNSITSAVRAVLAKKRIPDSKIVPLDDCFSLSLEDSLEDTILNQEGLDTLKETLSSHLSPLENKVFFLYLSGYSYSKIAEFVGISTKSVNNAMCRIKRKLNGLNSH